MRKVSEIRQKAQKVLSDNAVTNAPVDVYKLIENEGISILDEKMEDDHSGFLLAEEGKATIGINTSHHSKRKRFTAAHELGHYFLHAQGKDGLFIDKKEKAFKRSTVSSTGEDAVEIEANRFAAEILMPKIFIEEIVGDDEITDLYIIDLAIQFQVSEQAMTLRLVNLGLIDNY